MGDHRFSRGHKRGELARGRLLHKELGPKGNNWQIQSSRVVSARGNQLTLHCLGVAES